MAIKRVVFSVLLLTLTTCCTAGLIKNITVFEGATIRFPIDNITFPNFNNASNKDLYLMEVTPYWSKALLQWPWPRSSVDTVIAYHQFRGRASIIKTEIEIREARLDDGGDYHLDQERQGSGPKIRVQVNEIRVTAPENPVEFGQSVALTCSVGDASSASFTWIREDTGEILPGSLQGGLYTTVVHVGGNSAGNYTCRVGGYSGEGYKRITLLVKEPAPQMSVQKLDAGGRTGIALGCLAVIALLGLLYYFLVYRRGRGPYQPEMANRDPLDATDAAESEQQPLQGTLRQTVTNGHVNVDILSEAASLNHSITEPPRCNGETGREPGNLAAAAGPPGAVDPAAAAGPPGEAGPAAAAGPPGAVDPAAAAGPAAAADPAAAAGPPGAAAGPPGEADPAAAAAVTEPPPGSGPADCSNFIRDVALIYEKDDPEEDKVAAVLQTLESDSWGVDVFDPYRDGIGDVLQTLRLCNKGQHALVFLTCTVLAYLKQDLNALTPNLLVNFLENLLKTHDKKHERKIVVINCTEEELPSWLGHLQELKHGDPGFIRKLYKSLSTPKGEGTPSQEQIKQKVEQLEITLNDDDVDQVAAALGVPADVVTNIHQQYGGPKARLIQVIECWADRNGEKATAGKLEEVLQRLTAQPQQNMASLEGVPGVNHNIMPEQH